MGCFRSCLGKVFAGLLLLVAAYAGWRWGPVVFPRLGRWFGGNPEAGSLETGPSPALADSVLTRIQALRSGGAGGGELALTGVEITSLLRHSLPGLLPPGLADPAVEVRDGRLHLRARISPAEFPRMPDLGPLLGVLPDTVDFRAEASLVPYDEIEAAVVVHEAEASRIPIPKRLIPELLKALGRVERPGLPPDAVAVPIPAGLSSAYLLGDRLILKGGG